MRKSITTIAVAASLLFVPSVYSAETCAKGYGKTVAEAFEAGAKIAEGKDAELGEGWVAANTRIRILAEKEKGLFVAVVYSAKHKGPCELEIKTASVTRP